MIVSEGEKIRKKAKKWQELDARSINTHMISRNKLLSITYFGIHGQNYFILLLSNNIIWPKQTILQNLMRPRALDYS